MSLTRISAALRCEVRERARECCEYCLVAESQVFFPHEPDHVIAKKHGGKTSPRTWPWPALTAVDSRGRILLTIDDETGEVVVLFNPRIQRWSKHFQFEGGRIIPLTAIGRATEKLLRLNLPVRVEIRTRLANIGKYPLISSD